MLSHSMILTVLCHLCELNRASSREVAESFGFSSVKYLSLTLSRCKRRGFVDREPYQSGKEHGYVYWLTEKDAEWILRKVEVNEKDSGPRKPQVASKCGVDSRTEEDASLASPVLVRVYGRENRKGLNLAFWNLYLENTALKRENSELRASFEIAAMAIIAKSKRSLEKEFMS
jgi:DNA-binding HxlR family transcriptional regulator